MTVPQPTLGPNGFVVPTEEAILTAVQSDINAAFGNNLNMQDDTPQGQLAISQTAAIGNANDAFAFLSQQMDPAFNVGRYQDAIARIYFITRIPSSATVVTVTCGGLAGVVIPTQALVLDSAGNTYASLGAGTIGLTGTVDIQFACTTLGPIACPAGSITTIFQAINGWDTAINNADGVIGQDVETRNAFEQRRALAVANNSQGSLPSILGAVLVTPGVTDCFVTENVNQVNQIVGDVVISPNSVYVAAVGGLDAAVAQAIWSKKSPGCGYNGNTTVVVQDTSPVYSPPLPSYSVSFERPTPVTVTFTVTLANNPSIPANAATLVQNAILAGFTGSDGGPRARIGSLLLASRYYNDVNGLGSWATIINIKIGCSNNPASTFIGSISGMTLTISSVTGGVVTVGQQITGNGVVPGTVIQSGGGTSWQVSNNQTVSSGTMQGVTAIYDEVKIDIDESPVTAAANTVLVLM
jgi:hypothetical protein